MKKFIASSAAAVLIAAAAVFGGATAANAGWGHSVGGGTWNYFVDSNGPTNASEYYHPSAYHRASVENANGLVRDYALAGQWAGAYQKATLFGNKAAWYVF